MSQQSNNVKDYPHVDLLYPSKYVKAGDLRGQDVVVVIKKIDPRAELKRSDGTVDHKPVMHFDGKDKMFVCNKTNAISIAQQHGNDPRQWIGKPITLYSTTVVAFGKKHDCIRIREPNAADEMPPWDGPPPEDLEGGEL